MECRCPGHYYGKSISYFFKAIRQQDNKAATVALHVIVNLSTL
jgi:hypothetical protein